MNNAVTPTTFLMKGLAVLIVGILWIILPSYRSFAQIVTLQSHQKISSTQGNFTGAIGDLGRFGEGLRTIGDIDDDGVMDLAVGELKSNDGGPTRGAVWILFLNDDGTVRDHQKISDTQGNFTATLDNDDLFSHSIAALGDLDGDGVEDIAVGASRDDDGGNGVGAMYILF